VIWSRETWRLTRKGKNAGLTNHINPVYHVHIAVYTTVMQMSTTTSHSNLGNAHGCLVNTFQLTIEHIEPLASYSCGSGPSGTRYTGRTGELREWRLIT